MTLVKAGLIHTDRKDLYRDLCCGDSMYAFWFNFQNNEEVLNLIKKNYGWSWRTESLVKGDTQVQEFVLPEEYMT